MYAAAMTRLYAGPGKALFESHAWEHSEVQTLAWNHSDGAATCARVEEAKGYLKRLQVIQSESVSNPELSRTGLLID